MVNIISTGCEVVWRWMWRFNGGKRYLRRGGCIMGYFETECGSFCGGGGVGKADGWVKMRK